ncbi:MAG TPA: ABC transporter ATP-binding protein, partial [Labilithrix sp.]|nr:ABC transporter ATP-binding protein [Labilithrix sp.]
KLRLRGAVVVRFGQGSGPAPVEVMNVECTKRSGALPEPFAAALAAPKVAPLRLVAELAALDHPRAALVLVLAVAAAVVVTTLDALLFRGALEASRQLTLGYQRAGGVAVLAALTGVGLALEWFVASLVHRVGRALEVRLRAGLLEKLPRLEDRYLQSRPTSDMASRGHAMQVLREIPGLAARVGRASFTLVATVVGLVWIDPHGWPWAVLGAGSAALLPYLLSRPLAERSMRMRTHASALDRFYLDALRGATPVRVHGAQRAVRREHESLLVDWSGAARSLHAQTSLMQGVQLLATSAFSIVLVGSFVARSGATASLLLLVFWALRLSATGNELALTFGALRDLRNVAARLFAPLGAPERDPLLPEGPCGPVGRGGVAVRFRAVGSGASGRTILRDVTADIPPGAHVGVVGASGAGKSSLVGLLLGFLPVTEGTVEVDGAALDAARLAHLRPQTAWVDPAVHLWNRSLLDNLAFGQAPSGALPRAMADADLLEVVERLPEGMQTNLYEGGVRLSGGQGQRVRLARALLRAGSRLVLLDEPFRGMPRRQRQSVLQRARAHWERSTLILVSHDVSDTVDLDRVIVMDGGTVVEQGAPQELLARDSRYRALVLADAALRTATWSKELWSQRSVVEGAIASGVDA